MPTDAKLLSAYLAVGADELKRQTVVRRLKARLGDDPMVSFNLDEQTAGPSLAADDLLVSLDTMPFGSDFRLVIVHGAEKLAKDVSEAIVGYLAGPNPDTVLCLEATSLPKSTRLYKAVAKVGPRAVIDCSPKKRWELPKLVRSMAVAHGTTISEAAAKELVSRVGESTVYLDTQLETLAALTRQAGVITLADVEGHVARTAEVKPWDFLDAVSERDAKRALGLLALMDAASPLALESLLCTRIRELVCAKALEARGEGALLAQTLGKQAWQVKNHQRWARGFTERELVSALAGAVACERQLKGSGDGEAAFRAWVLSIV